MEEQPRTDPPRRVPAKATPRPRAAKPRFTPPDVIDGPAAGVAGADPGTEAEPGSLQAVQPPPGAGAAPAAPRASRSRAKAAPPVLFQPPAGGQTGPGAGQDRVGPASPSDAPEAAPTPEVPTPAAPTPDAASVRKRATAAKRPASARKVSPARQAPAGSPAEETLPATPKPRRSARSTRPADQPEPEQQARSAQGSTRAPRPELAPDPGQGSGRTLQWPAAPTTAQILDHPGHAPELLALAAVATIGPRARSWADRMRATYPAATPDGLARLATRRFVRLARAGGAVAAVSGLLAPLAELSAVAGTQAGLVLHLAAAHGRDPGHPDRAAELLVLMQVQPDLDAAGSALDAARDAVDGGSGPPHRIAEAGWRLAAPLAAQTGGWLALRLAARLMPGAAVLAAAAGNSATAERLAARAVAHYRGTAVGTG